MVEISRNNVLETRDWNRTASEAPAGDGLRGGIVIILVTPPTLPTTGSSFTNAFTNAAGIAGENFAPVYEPGLPALRIEHNVVRVPLGEALAVAGFGPFSIVNNQLGCGGTVKEGGRPLAETVLILNMGNALEVASLSGKFAGANRGVFGNASIAPSRGFAGTAGGAVIFTNNICELESGLSQRRCISSVAIFSLDDLIFSNNQCWVDGPPLTAILDAFLIAGSLQVTTNRFQEALGFAVILSGLTLGALNITMQNISTYCLFAKGFLQPEIDVNNLVAVINPKLCDELGRQLNL